jgi:hypothetical protein
VSGFADLIPELAPEWFGRYPMQKNSHGVRFNLGRGDFGGLLANNVFHWEHGEWQDVDPIAKPNRAGGFGWAHLPEMQIHPGGYLQKRELTYGIRSIGVMQRGEYRPKWRAGACGIDRNRLLQACGPYEVETTFDMGSTKQEILLPQMPAVDGDALVLDYFARGLVPPDRCGAKPVVVDALGREVPMQRWRTPWGKQESIPLDVLASLAFPVVLDPEICGGGLANWSAGANDNYASARATALSWNGAATTNELGQRYAASAGADYNVNRHGNKLIATAYSGLITAAQIRMSCSAITRIPVTDDSWQFKQCDWDAWDPPDLFTIENVFDCIRTSTEGALLGLNTYYYGLGCSNIVGSCVYGDYYDLTAADCTWLNSHNGLGGNLYWGVMSEKEHDATAPTTVDSCFMHTSRGSICPTCLKFNEAAGGGWSWLVS